MDLIPEAQAQTAEATKVATDAATLLLQNQVYGAACVFLLIAVGVLFWLLHRAQNDKTGLVERIITVAEQSKAAADDNTDATKALTAAIAALTAAVQALSRETEGEAREVRHGLANVVQIANGIAEMLRDLRSRGRE